MARENRVVLDVESSVEGKSYLKEKYSRGFSVESI